MSDLNSASVISAMADNNKKIAENLCQALCHLTKSYGKISEAKRHIRQALELLQEEAKPL